MIPPGEPIFAPTPPVRPKPRRGFTFRFIAIGLIVSLLMAAAAAAFIYWRYIRYERVAARHIPPDSVAAVRVDVEQVVLYEPVRRHLLPLVDDLGDAAKQPAVAPRLKRIQQYSGIELGVDLREIVLARAERTSDWVVVLGGKFPKKDVLSGLAKMFAEEGQPWQLSADGRALVSAAGMALGQASDGSLILASTLARLESARPAQATDQRLGLPLDAAAGFALQGRLLHDLATGPVLFVLPALADLRSIERVTGGVVLEDAVEVRAELWLQPAANAEKVRDSVQQVLQHLSSAAGLLPGGEALGGQQALAAARVEAKRPNQVLIHVPWQREQLDRAAEFLAATVRTWVAASHLGPSTP